MIFSKDPIVLLTAFVVAGFIISAVIFTENTRTPLKINEQPQHFLAKF